MVNIYYLGLSIIPNDQGKMIIGSHHRPFQLLQKSSSRVGAFRFSGRKFHHTHRQGTKRPGAPELQTARE